MHLFPDFLLVIPTVSQSSVDVSHRQMREARDNFVGREDLQFMLNIDILHTYARARNTRPAPANLWLAHNTIRICQIHICILIVVVESMKSEFEGAWFKLSNHLRTSSIARSGVDVPAVRPTI